MDYPSGSLLFCPGEEPIVFNDHILVYTDINDALTYFDPKDMRVTKEMLAGNYPETQKDTFMYQLVHLLGITPEIKQVFFERENKYFNEVWETEELCKKYKKQFDSIIEAGLDNGSISNEEYEKIMRGWGEVEDKRIALKRKGPITFSNLFGSFLTDAFEKHGLNLSLRDYSLDTYFSVLYHHDKDGGIALGDKGCGVGDIMVLTTTRPIDISNADTDGFPYDSDFTVLHIKPQVYEDCDKKLLPNLESHDHSGKYISPSDLAKYGIVERSPFEDDPMFMAVEEMVLKRL